jgi:tubulin--tyrosine ligase
MASYRDFLFKVNFAHGRYHPLSLREDITYMKVEMKYHAYVGRGNNSLLIKSLLKRRFWWTIDDDHKNSNFIWTQLKINSCFEREKPCTTVYAIEQ